MTIVNNVYAIRVNSVSNNGSMNFGTVTHTGHRATSFSKTGYEQTGDILKSSFRMENINEADRPAKKESSDKKQKEKGGKT